ncbi:MAG: M61 family metallopeptidase [Oculatellaceae cyanobacterium bins.114]|nr:M61 family metallopeptidase [Oculatellaceae cyanobacterium bins.114]
MTEATQLRPTSQSLTQIELHYHVSMPQPESHLFEVTLQVKGWAAAVLNLKMPVWTPGSYLVREYARHLQDFQAQGAQPLTWQKVSKNHWRVETPGVADITVRYRLFANELTVRTNHLDSTHGYFNPAALCFYVPGFEQNPIRLTVVPPQADWRVTTPLEAIAGQPNTFEAPDFDTLVDSPFEIGHHQLYEFEAFQKPHTLAVWGQGNLEPDRVIADTRKIIEVEAELFGGLPYDRYLFLLHLSSQGFGGLEHKTSCTLNYSRFGFRSQDKYNRFMQLVAHEFFHLWNVKRIRPKALEVFDYDGENYTPSLWFSEGTTSYYDLTIPFRAGIYNAQAFLRALSKEITRFLTTPGRLVQPLSESSFDAWIKLYRRDAYSDNSQMSYYLKGEMVSLLLDLLIRERHGNERSLDDVMRRMWHQFGQVEIGFTVEDLQSVIESVSDMSLSHFFHRYLNTTEEIPFNKYLEPFGLQLTGDNADDYPPFVGMVVKTENGRESIKFVEVGSPAHQAGIDIGDELLALDGVRVSADQWSDRLCDYNPGDTIQLTIFHQDELKTYSVTLAEPRSTNYQIVPVDRPSATQDQNFAGWLGCSLAALR